MSYYFSNDETIKTEEKEHVCPMVSSSSPGVTVYISLQKKYIVGGIVACPARDTLST